MRGREERQKRIRMTQKGIRKWKERHNRMLKSKNKMTGIEKKRELGRTEKDEEGRGVERQNWMKDKQNVMKRQTEYDDDTTKWNNERTERGEREREKRRNRERMRQKGMRGR